MLISNVSQPGRLSLDFGKRSLPLFYLPAWVSDPMRFAQTCPPPPAQLRKHNALLHRSDQALDAHPTVPCIGSGYGVPAALPLLLLSVFSTRQLPSNSL